MDPPTLRAYVVEDNPRLCKTLVDTLQAMTCVRVIGTGHTEAQALWWLTRHVSQWDLLVVDLFLRGGSGMRLIERLIERSGARAPWQKVVLFSNHVSAGLRKRTAQVGVDAVFDKATEVDAFLDYCARLCGQQGTAETADASAPQK